MDSTQIASNIVNASRLQLLQVLDRIFVENFHLRVHLENQDPGKNLRAAVEATVRPVNHPFRSGNLSVRGQFRVTCLVIASASHVNGRRICWFLV